MGGQVAGVPVIGSLTDHQFIWGDNDSLGFDTVYIRDDTGDPDTEGTLVECSNGVRNYIYYLRHDYITVDGIATKRSNGHGIRLTGDGTNIIIQNCHSSYDYWGIGGYAGCHDSQILDSEIEFSVGSGFGINGSIADPLTGLVFRGNVVHDIVEYYAGLGYWEAAGTKLFAHNGSVISKNEFYNCPQGGIRFDGLSVEDPLGGMRNCEISENDIHACGYSGIEIEFSGYNTIKHNLLYDLEHECSGIQFSHSMSDGNIAFSNIIIGSTENNIHAFYTQTNAGDGGHPNYVCNNVVVDAWNLYTSASLLSSSICRSPF
jgi:parallel beta-helix repeat protein